MTVALRRRRQGELATSQSTSLAYAGVRNTSNNGFVYPTEGQQSPHIEHFVNKRKQSTPKTRQESSDDNSSSTSGRHYDISSETRVDVENRNDESPVPGDTVSNIADILTHDDAITPLLQSASTCSSLPSSTSPSKDVFPSSIATNQLPTKSCENMIQRKVAVFNEYDSCMNRNLIHSESRSSSSSSKSYSFDNNSDVEATRAECSPILSADSTKGKVLHNSLFSSTDKKHKVIKWSTIVNRVWIIHFAFAVSILFIAMQQNNNPYRKYILVPIKESSVQHECKKLFVNVMASSSQESDSVLCCKDDDTTEVSNNLGTETSPTYQSFCALTSHSNSNRSWLTTLSNLPFASRLAKFPDAWILPLAPLLLKFLYGLISKILTIMYIVLTTGTMLQQNNNTTVNANKSSGCQELNPNSDNSILSQSAKSSQRSVTNTISYGLRRLLLYFLIMIIRGWVLYAGLNIVEEKLLHVFKPSDTINSYSEEETCWYQDLVDNNSRVCPGRDFDFSDHMVLYYAQILPIALMETIYSFQRLYLDATYAAKDFILPTVLVLCHLYMQLITAVGAYKTATFFHTGGEVLVGFAISFIISAFLWRMQCSEKDLPKSFRLFFFGSL